MKEEEEKVVGTINAVAGSSSEYEKRIMPQTVYDEYIRTHYPEEKWIDARKGVYAWDKERKMLVCKHSETGEIIYSIGPANYEDIPFTGYELSKAYAEKEARKQKEIYLKYGRFTDNRVARKLDGYMIEELLTPQQLFMKNVEEGKVKDPVTGLKLSENQVKGKPPDQGFLQEVLGGSDEYYKVRNSSPYFAGLVVKICGDYDPELSDDHNTYAIITKVLDPWHYEAIQEFSSKKLILRDTDVKGWIGNWKRDFVGIGKERHEKEIKPIIKKALHGKEPVSEPDPEYVSKPDKDCARRLAYRIDEELKGVEKKLREIEEKKDKYTGEDYERLKAEQESWVKMLRQVKEEVEKLGVDEVVKRGWKE
jgi:hypothetical protein